MTASSSVTTQKSNKGLLAGKSIIYCNFSQGFAVNNCNNFISPVNLAWKRSRVPYFSMGALWDLQISQSWLDSYFTGFTPTCYFLSVTARFIMETHPFLLKNKSKTSALCEEAIKRWWFLSVSKPASFGNPANINHMLELHFPFLRAWCLIAGYRSWQKHTSQEKQWLCKPNIPMDHSQIFKSCLKSDFQRKIYCADYYHPLSENIESQKSMVYAWGTPNLC